VPIKKRVWKIKTYFWY